MAVRILPPASDLGPVVEPILRALPGWFGVESAIVGYVAAADAGLTWLAVDTSSHARRVGFLTTARHGPASAEIIVMGVLPERHRAGVGRALVAAAEAHLRADGVRFLQVKTLSPLDPDEGYARTRAFYEALGFVLLEELPDLWGPDNPCALLVKALDA
jgi:GNAT superfamily N-acetyltransferase